MRTLFLPGLSSGLAQQGLCAAPTAPQLKLHGCQETPDQSPSDGLLFPRAFPPGQAQAHADSQAQDRHLTLLSSCRLNDMWTIGLQDRELTCWEEVRGWGPGLRLWGYREVGGVGGPR